MTPCESRGVVVPAPRDVWRQVLAADADALTSQTPEWLDAMCSDGSYVDASRLYIAADGSRAVLPLARRRAVPRTWHSYADGWGFGGLVSEAPVTPELVDRVLDDVSARRPLRVRLRPNPLQAAAWADAAAGRGNCVPSPVQAHALDLAGGFDQVWAHRFRSSTRRHVRHAERAGVRIETSTDGRLLPVFYRLLELSVERWARRQHEPLALAHYRLGRRDPLRKFEQIARLLTDSCRVSVAWVDRAPAAAIVVLRDGNAHYTRGAMDEALAGPSRANRLLHSVEIQSACRAGCRWYHMGDSRPGSGLARFKEGFGAEPVDYAVYRLESLPWHRTERAARQLVKTTIGFRDGP